MQSLLLFVTTFALYLFSLAPSITVGDSGEFCAASTILGLPHSPGYPLYCLLGKAIEILVPLGNLAYRVNILSALCAALTVVLVAATARRLLDERDGSGSAPAAAFIASLLLAVSPAFWQSAVQAEVFTLNALFAAAIVWAWSREYDFLAVFLFGLGLGNHHTLIFLVPLLLWLFIRNGGISVRRVALALLFFAAGFSVYLYLPARSFKNPALDWGNPETVHNIWRVISRADYGTMALTTGEKLGRDIVTQWQQLARYFTAVGKQFTVAGLLIGIAGCWLLLKKRKAAILLVSWCVVGPGFMLLANMPFNSETAGIMERFYVLSNLLWAFPLAAALQVCMGARAVKVWTTAGIAAVIVVAGWRMPEASWRNYYLAYDYGRNLFRTLAPGSLFLMDGGDDTFYSTVYLQAAEKRRPDIELHDRGGLVFKNIYGADFRRLSREEKDRRRHEVERQYLDERPVYYSTFNRQALPGVPLSPDGILYRAGRAVSANAFGCYSLRSVFVPQYADYRSRALVPVYAYFGALQPGAERLAWWEYALLRWDDAMWLKGNLHVELAQAAYDEFAAGRLANAERLYLKTAALFPDDAAAMSNLGVVYEKRGNLQKAKEWYQQATIADPRATDGYFNLAVVYWQERNWADAVRCLERLLAVQPQDARARQYLPLARQRLAAEQRGG